jgi:hypothetical protein
MTNRKSYGELYDEAVRSGRSNMETLCESFPTLRGKPGTKPWDQETFARWASGPAPSNAIRQAAAFVLSVWAGRVDEPYWNEGEFRVGTFDVVLAFGLWDYQHNAAFIAWCQDPFWP